MEIDNLAGAFAVFDHSPISGIGKQMLAEIVSGFSFVGSKGVDIID
jgi:hypothetical protein